MENGRSTASPQQIGRTDTRRWLALAVLCAATFIVILDGSIVFVAMPSIATKLRLSAGSVQWVISGYLLAFGGLLLLGGRMADLLGRRRIFMIGGALLAVSSLLCGLSWSGDVLIGARVLQGLSAAIMTPTALSILVNTFKEGRERNMALGAWSSAGGVGGTIGALLGGPLTEGPGWGWIFFVNVPVAIAMVAMSPRVLRESYDRSRAKTFDVAGALTSTVAMVLAVYAIVNAPTVGWGSARTIGLFVAVAVLLAVFVVIEQRSAAPLVPLRYFRSGGFLGGNIVIAAVGMAVNGGMGFVMTEYAQVVLGYSAVQFGLMFAVMTVLTILGSTLAGGPLVSRFGARPVALAGLLLVGLSLVTLTHISAHGNFVSDILPGMVLFGPGLGASFVAGSIAALARVPEHDSGFASSVTTAAFHVGGALGIAVMSTVAVVKAVGSDPATAMVTGFRSAYGVALVFIAVGIVAAVAFLRGPQRQTAAVVTTLPDRRRDAA
jgi:EmrB/QacA subfamily drug resistance transporter